MMTMPLMHAGALALALSAAAPPALGQPADPLVGLWSYQMRTEPVLHGPLTVTRDGAAWRATIAGRQAYGQAFGAELRFSFRGGLGQFRGRLAADRGALRGYWLQPAGKRSGGDPGGAGQAFASPVTLAAAGAGAWRGAVTPLANSFTLYLKVFRDTDGTLIAAFRNPEMNATGGRTQFVVSHDGANVRFASRAATDQRPVAISAKLAGDHLKVAWPGAAGTLDLVRLTPAEAAAFFPRPPESPPYAYRRPPTLADGWATARAAQVGLDEAALTRLVQAHIDSDPAGPRPQLLHSILVARHGKLVLEEYFFGADRMTPHETRSAAKTYGSVMLGAVMLHDRGIGPESRIYDIAQRLGPFAHPDPRKARITLAQLMTHTSGLACDDNDDASPGNEATMQSQTAQPNWWKYALDLPMAHDPGTRYAYCSANSNLTGAALTLHTGTWLPELFDRTVARPLDFGRYYWNLMPNGEGYAGGGAYLTSRDFLKIGQAFLDGGVWRGRRIVGADWVKDSTAPHVQINPATTGLSPEAFGNAYIESSDGYAWHLNSLKVGDRIFRDYEAGGNGGQQVIVVPDADLVVAFTGGNFGQGGIWLRWRQQFIGDQILPAIRQDSPR